MRKKLLSILLALVLCLGLLPVSSSAADVSYPVTGGNLLFDPATGTITGCDDSVTSAEIPSAIYGVPVVTIGYRAFHDKKNLASVSIPSTVTSIEYNAFVRSGLTSITIPGSVQSIGEDAFASCRSLVSATLQSGVPAVEQSMFENCNRLETVSLPDSVTKIGRSAFAGCSCLYSIKIPDSVTYMEARAFKGCDSLTSITIPGSIPEIKNETFYECDSLTNVIIEDGVQKIGTMAFSYCKSLETLIVPDSVTLIDGSAFGHNEALKEVSFGSGLEVISTTAFSRCKSLTTVGFSSGLKQIKDNAFNLCPALTDVYYTGGMTEWSAIELGRNNESLSSSKFHWNTRFIPSPAPAPPTEGKVSDWAKPEIEKAKEQNLIPDSLIKEDLTKPINRVEFAAVCVKVFENLTSSNAIPAAANPFSDTSDPEVLKALNVGITNGTSDTTFSPGNKLSREEAATMLTRVFKRCTIPGWTLLTDSDFPLNYTQPARFADDASISEWAKDSVYFMVSNNIIQGVGSNLFAPKNTTTEQEARGYANATREQALAIAVRMVENLK